MQGQLFAQVAAAIEHAEAFRAEQPFVPIGHGEGAVAGLDVEGLGTELLDGVHAQQYTFAATACAQAQQVQAQAAGVLHGADRQQPRARPAGGEQGGLRVTATQVDLHHLDTAWLQGLPDDAVGGKLLVADHHLVASSPIQSERDEGEGFRSVFDQCNIRGARCVQQALEALTQAPLHLQPGRIITGTAAAVLFGEAADGLAGALRPGRHGGVIEVAKACS